MIEPLADTANGSIPLEIYIQRAFFDKIIARANKRFSIMTDGQYSLHRRNEKKFGGGYDGLELDVTDHWNGTTRSVKTLSGGESFKASLSLALGLSEEIQSSAGGIQLDSMFVDEGFGSLDEHSLRQAMKALSDLSEDDRLIGIISHVSELKTKIDKQIIVKKTTPEKAISMFRYKIKFPAFSLKAGIFYAIKSQRIIFAINCIIFAIDKYTAICYSIYR